MSVRLESTGAIAHTATRGEFTLCGIMYSTEPEPGIFRIVGATVSGDPVDCMSCLVQETREEISRTTTHVTVILPIPCLMMTFVLEPDE